MSFCLSWAVTAQMVARKTSLSVRHRVRPRQQQRWMKIFQAQSLAAWIPSQHQKRVLRRRQAAMVYFLELSSYNELPLFFSTYNHASGITNLVVTRLHDTPNSSSARLERKDTEPSFQRKNFPLKLK